MLKIVVAIFSLTIIFHVVTVGDAKALELSEQQNLAVFKPADHKSKMKLVSQQSVADRIQIFEKIANGKQPANHAKPKVKKLEVMPPPIVLDRIEPLINEHGIKKYHRESNKLEVLPLPIVLDRLLPLIDEHGIERYHREPKVMPYSKYRLEEQKLAGSFTKYFKQAETSVRNNKNKNFCNWVKSKWSMIVLKFFVKTFYEVKKRMEAEINEIVVNRLKELEKMYMETLEKATMKIVAANLTLEGYNNKELAKLPDVDLSDFTALEPESYLKEVEQECQNRNKSDLCNLAKLIAVALNSIVVGKYFIVVCFLGEGSNKWLTETNIKLMNMYNEQVLHRFMREKEKIQQTTLLELLNYAWASQFLQKLDEKYQHFKKDLPNMGESRLKINRLYKQILALKLNVDEHQISLKEKSMVYQQIPKKKFEKINLDQFFSKNN